MNGALVVLLLGGAGAAYASLSDGSEPEVAATPTTRVTRGTVLASVSASGSVESARARDLGFGTSGTVEKIYVDVGDKVKKGQVLARLDDTAAEESLAAAKAALDAAADGDTDTAAGYAQYVSARNTYRQAKRTLAGTVIKAPFAGTVVALNGTVGGSSSATGGSSGSSGSASPGGGGSGAARGGGSSSSSGGSSGGFVRLADTKRLQVVGEFTEADVTKLKVGQPATFSFDALAGVTASGEVTLIDPVAHTSDNVVQYAVTISMTEVPETVRLGQTATVRVVVDRADDVLSVPSSSVTTAGGRTTVTVLENGREVVTPVEVGVRGDTMTEIRSGLREGDEVVRRLAGTGTTGGFGRFPGFGGFGGGTRVRVGGGGGGR